MRFFNTINGSVFTILLGIFWGVGVGGLGVSRGSGGSGVGG
jgi:hypothetical protein